MVHPHRCLHLVWLIRPILRSLCVCTGWAGLTSSSICCKQSCTCRSRTASTYIFLNGTCSWLLGFVSSQRCFEWFCWLTKRGAFGGAVVSIPTDFFCCPWAALCLKDEVLLPYRTTRQKRITVRQAVKALSSFSALRHKTSFSFMTYQTWWQALGITY